MRKWFIVTVAMLAVAGLILAAGPALAKKKPIKIGAFFAMSGPAAFIGAPTKLVAEMVVAEINKAGGINGRPIVLIIGDTEGKPPKAVSIAKKFIHQDKVVAVIGPTRTGTGMAVKKLFEQAKIPVFMTVGGDPVIMKIRGVGYTWIFKSPQRSSTAISVLMAYLKRHKISKIGVITANDGFGRDGKRWLTKLAPKFGITIVAAETFGARDVDMKPQLTKIKAKNPQAIVCWTIGPAGSIVSKNVAQLGIKGPLFQCHGLPDPKYIMLAGKAANGNLMPATKLLVADQLPAGDPQKPVILKFIKLYKKYGYEKKFPINAHSAYAWDAIMIVAMALKKAGTDAAKLRSAIENTKNYVGVSGTYNLSPTDHNGLGIDSMVILKIVGGKWKLVK
ncbi:MAG: ABC transporter substrate-binding protein [Proteobacteria bacterium]|nr:ABC transporter substrate-binding protein [Pseudomonadota bacterium]